MATSVCKATAELLFAVRRRFRPTPDAPAYVFSVHDVARVTRGLVFARLDTLHERHELVKLWAHESKRAFEDRLQTDDERRDFDDLLGDAIQANFRTQWRPWWERGLSQTTLFNGSECCMFALLCWCGIGVALMLYWSRTGATLVLVGSGRRAGSDEERRSRSEIPEDPRSRP